MKKQMLKNKSVEKTIEPPGVTLMSKVDGNYWDGVVFTTNGIVQVFARPPVPGRDSHIIWLNTVHNGKRTITSIEKTDISDYTQLTKYARQFVKLLEDE